MAVFGEHDILILQILCRFYSEFFSQFWFRLKRHSKHSIHCLTAFSNTTKFVKNTPLRVVFSTLFSVWSNAVFLFDMLLCFRGKVCSKRPLSLPCLVTGWWWPQRSAVGLSHQALRRTLTWLNLVSHVMVLKKCSLIGSWDLRNPGCRTPGRRWWM